MSTQCETRRGEAQRDVLIRDPGTFFVQIYCLMVALAMGLSAVILFGGDRRFETPTFAGPRNLVDWIGINPRYTWGLVFAVLGVALIVSMRKAIAKQVLRAGLVVYVFLTVTFIWSAFAAPTAVLTGVVAYSIFATAHLLLAAHLEKWGWQ